MLHFFRKYKLFNFSILLVIPLFLILFLISFAGDIEIHADNAWWKEEKTLKNSTVLLNNQNAFIPFNYLDTKVIASVNVGSNYSADFDSIISKYTKITFFAEDNYSSALALDSLPSKLKNFNTIILKVTESSLTKQPVQSIINELNKSKQLVVIVYGNSSALQFLDKITCPIIWNPKNTSSSAIFIAQALFGGLPFSGKLDQNVSSNYTAGTGFTTSVTRLKYTMAEELGINPNDLEKPIDRIVEEAISQKATPGAVVMVVKDGNVIFNKAYGKHTYKDNIPESENDVFDLASVTKIGATTIAAMRLYEEQKLALDSTMGSYIPVAKQTNKSTITVKDLLLHQAGLTPYIPFFLNLKLGEYSRDSSFFHPLKVADNYYLRPNYFEEVMYPRMLNTAVQPKGRYNYSDLSMYFLKDIVERQAMERLDKYVEKQFYAPLGMQTAGFNPRQRLDKNRIVPTEQDNSFRKTLLEGYVHDPGAAMAGGISGHAGLFSSANDMAILFQMFLNGGTYGGQQYFKKETIDLFTAKYSNVSRRGLGFDRWDPDRTNRYPSDLASPKSYGHTGYTGTCVWVDPEYNLIYIFLSNRVHPSVTNKLSTLRIRPRIQDVIYTAIRKAERNR